MAHVPSSVRLSLSTCWLVISPRTCPAAPRPSVQGYTTHTWSRSLPLGNTHLYFWTMETDWDRHSQGAGCPGRSRSGAGSLGGPASQHAQGGGRRLPRAHAAGVQGAELHQTTAEETPVHWPGNDRELGLHPEVPAACTRDCHRGHGPQALPCDTETPTPQGHCAPENLSELHAHTAQAGAGTPRRSRLPLFPGDV